MSDETYPPTDAFALQDRLVPFQPAVPSEGIDAHEVLSGYGDPGAHDTGSEAGRQPAIDAHRAMSANGTGAESRCHQYERRRELNAADLPHCPFPRQQLKADAEGLWRVVVTNIESAFRFVPVSKEEIARVEEIEEFILRYEWLGSMPYRPSHYFTARTLPERGDMLVGVVVLARPMAFSKLLGEDTKHHEAVIARGAVVSWAPMSLNSWLLARALGWMVTHTEARLFVGYGDPRANEIGTIYQALNFYYLGQDYGVTSAFLDPETGSPLHPIGNRHPRHVAMFQRYAKDAGIDWSTAWTTGTRLNWSSVPPEIAAVLRDRAEAYQQRLDRVAVPPKHKYVLVKGATPKETRHLRKRFQERNAALIQPYPSEERRGAVSPPPKISAQPLVRLSEVASEAVTWLWMGRIPYGKLTLLEGDPDVGKSMVAYDLAACVTTGAPMPGATTRGPAGGVVILSAEDGLADTIRPRLDAAGADLARVVSFPFDAMPTIPDDLNQIERAIFAVGAKLVIVDPLVAFFGDRIRATNDQKVRRALTPLAALAQRTGVAILGIRHLTKNERAATKYRGGGSIGLLGAARAVLLAASHPADPAAKIVVPVKGNLSAASRAIAYRIAPAGPVACIEWLDEVDYSAEALLTPRPKGRDGLLVEAMNFLRSALAAGERAATDVLREAAEAGIADITLRRARKELRISIGRLGFGPGSKIVWRLPENDSDRETIGVSRLQP